MTEEQLVLVGELQRRCEAASQNRAWRCRLGMHLVHDQRPCQRRPNAPWNQQGNEQRSGKQQGAEQGRFIQQPPNRTGEHEGHERCVQYQHEEADGATTDNAAQEITLHGKTDSGTDGGEHPCAARQQGQHDHRMRAEQAAGIERKRGNETEQAGQQRATVRRRCLRGFLDHAQPDNRGNRDARSISTSEPLAPDQSTALSSTGGNCR